MAGQIFTITQQEIYHTGQIGKDIAIGYLHQLVGVLNRHRYRNIATTQGLLYAGNTAGQCGEIRVRGIVAIHRVATFDHFHDHCTVVDTAERSVFVQQQIVTFRWNQEIAVFAVGAAFFQIHVQIALGHESCHPVAQAYV